MITLQEIWRDIEGHEGLYQISNLGRVKSLGNFKTKKTKILKNRNASSGYLNVMLNNRKYYYIHRLVAQAFISNPENKRTVNHKNGIKTDNRVENLEWNTYSENLKHAFKNGLKNKIWGANTINLNSLKI